MLVILIKSIYISLVKIYLFSSSITLYILLYGYLHFTIDVVKEGIRFYIVFSTTSLSKFIHVFYFGLFVTSSFVPFLCLNAPLPSTRKSVLHHVSLFFRLSTFFFKFLFHSCFTLKLRYIFDRNNSTHTIKNIMRVYIVVLVTFPKI